MRTSRGTGRFLLFCGSRSLLSLPFAEGKRYRRYSGAPFFLNPQQRVYLRRYSGAAGGGDFTPSEGVHNGRLRRPGMPGSPGGDKRGRDTKVSLPLLTPQPFLRTRLPSVARLKARGPQGRLVLQGTPLDRSGAFRSANQAPCTVWPRTVMRGGLRKENSGHYSHI